MPAVHIGNKKAKTTTPNKRYMSTACSRHIPFLHSFYANFRIACKYNFSIILSTDILIC